jgi:hypothetical protein
LSLSSHRKFNLSRVRKLVLDCIEARSRAKDEFRSGGFELFWTAYQPYLAGWGYTLYDILDKDYSAMTPPSLCPPPPAHPYAFVAYDPEDAVNDHHVMVIPFRLSPDATTF